MPRSKKDQMTALMDEQARDDAQDAPMEEIKPDKEPAQPVRYEQAPDTVTARMNRIMEKYHGEMKEAGVIVGCVSAIAGKNSKGVKPAIVVRGHPRLSAIKRIEERDQIAAMNSGGNVIDVRMVIDQNAYDEMNAAKQDALIDDALSSLMLKREGNKPEGEVKVNGAGRPVLKLRHHDEVIEIHASVLARHKADHPSFPAISRLVQDFQQLELPYANAEKV